MVFTTSLLNSCLITWLEQTTELGVCDRSEDDMLVDCTVLSGAPLAWRGRVEGWWEWAKMRITKGK
jgi:hypothetical protein